MQFRFKEVLQKRIRNADRCRCENRREWSCWAPDEKAMQLNERAPPSRREDGEGKRGSCEYLCVTNVFFTHLTSITVSASCSHVKTIVRARRLLLS